MEEHLHNSIARSVSKQCALSDDQIKDLFYIFKVKQFVSRVNSSFLFISYGLLRFYSILFNLKQISRVGIIDGDNRNLTMTKVPFLKLNKDICEWKGLCNPEVADKIFNVTENNIFADLF